MLAFTTKSLSFLSSLLLISFCGSAHADENAAVMIKADMIHLRATDEREWSSFPKVAQAKALKLQFDSRSNRTSWTLTIRQQDVKFAWEVQLNGKKLGKLSNSENDLRIDFELPPDAVKEGENTLTIEQTGRSASDDIRVGEIELHPMSPSELRSQATLEIHVTEKDVIKKRNASLPSRVTVVDETGALVPVGVISGDGIAVREGVVYTATGFATIPVAPGEYKIYAGRGFEYSLAETTVKIKAKEHLRRSLSLTRQVDTTGWVACDTHVHTLTHSGHGDSTVAERMITLAGEGIELPIATDHNKQIAYEAPAKSAGVSKYFTPVIGNEVTTNKGHYNVFPLIAEGKTPDHTLTDWAKLFENIWATPNARVAILNHARDVHRGFRPFSPRHHLSLTGENLTGRKYHFNAMEVLNSGAVQTDPLELFHDWCGLINFGLDVTPVGSSDSHDVTRYIVGQGRTYIECDDSDVAAIEVEKAIDSFIAGKVIVSYGLFLQLEVDRDPADDKQLRLTAIVQSPEWTQAEDVAIYINGRREFVHRFEETEGKQTVVFRLPVSKWKHDLWFTAAAIGPGVASPAWPTAKAYQPDSIDFASHIFSCSGAMKVDLDGDGAFTSPRAYAQQLVNEHQDEKLKTDTGKLAAALQNYHPSVTHQVASLLRSGEPDKDGDLAALQDVAQGSVRKEIAIYQRALRESINAQIEERE